MKRRGTKKFEQLKMRVWKFKKWRQMCCDHWEKRKRIYPTNHIYQLAAFSTKFYPDIDFTDEWTVESDIPFVKNGFVDDF